MSPTGRPEGEHRSAQREGSSIDPTGRPEGEHRSAQRAGSLAGSRRTRVKICGITRVADGLYLAGADYDARFGLPPTVRDVTVAPP